MKSAGTIIAAIFGFIFVYVGLDLINHENNSSTGIIYRLFVFSIFNLIGIVLLIVAVVFFILALIGIVNRIKSKK
jgi:type III secretory pathway component EscT